MEVGPLSQADADAVRRLAQAAQLADAVAPLSEVPLLHLSADEPWLTHLLLRTSSAGVQASLSSTSQSPASRESGARESVTADVSTGDSAAKNLGKVVAYAQVDRSGQYATAELVVDPDYRRAGLGRRLITTAMRDAALPQVSGTQGKPGLGLRIWAHGNLPAAQACAAALGLEACRSLMVLERPLAQSCGHSASLAAEHGDFPDGYRVRTFQPGHDDGAWVELNGRIFAQHPEQGRISLDDLHARMAEQWFRAEGFFLLEYGPDSSLPSGQPMPPSDGGMPASGLVGYVWTKIIDHSLEIYVIGVDAPHQGRGLAGALLRRALLYGVQQGCTQALLYVDASNTTALSTYARAGFTQAAKHVQYSVPSARTKP